MPLPSLAAALGRPRRWGALACLALFLACASPPGEEPAAAPPGSPETSPAAAPPAAAAAAGEPGPPIQGPLADPDTWSRVVERLFVRFVDFLPALAAAIVILAVFYLFYRLAARLLAGLMGRTKADPALRELGVRLIKYVILGFGCLVAAAQMGIHVGSLLAGLGVAGLAVGLAAQDTLANLIAGIILLWDRPFRIGDNVTIAGTWGRVMEVGLRTTRLRTAARLDAILPNKTVIAEMIINHTLNPQLRLPVPLSVAYKEDTRAAREVLLAAVAGHPLILDEPAPEVVVRELAESSVNLELRVWLRDPYTEADALFAMLELAKIALDEAGIEIPFPQSALHFPEGRVAVRLEREPEGEAR